MASFGEKMVNPIIRRALAQSEKTQENCVTYKGVIRKSALFLMTFVLGAILAIVVHAVTPQISYSDYAGTFSCSQTELILMIVTAVVGFVTSIIASFSYRSAAICGTLACVCFGYPIGFCAAAIPAYQGPILLALVLTVALVGTLLVLYRTRIIKVTQKFKAFMFTTIITVLVGSLFLLILSFIPATSGAVTWMYSNPAISITFGVLGVIIGCFFLLWDFDAVENAVTMGADKRYENMIAFSLAFSVIYLYFKILQLILRIMAASRN